MDNPIKTIPLGAGVTIKIYQDMNADSPDTWGDTNLYLMADHREFSVRSKDYQAFCDGSQHDDVWAFELNAYIHSGVSLSLVDDATAFPDHRWDVSRLGVVVASKSEFETREEAYKAAQGLVKTWNIYLRGDVYGYMIEDKDDNHLDGCWGFYDDTSDLVEVVTAATDAAQPHAEDAKRDAKERTEKYIRLTKEVGASDLNPQTKDEILSILTKNLI